MNARLALSLPLPDSPRQLFRLLLLYRWLSLAAPVLFLFFAPSLPAVHWLALALAVVTNLLINLFAAPLNRLLQARPLLLSLDLLLVSLLLALSGAERSPYYLYALSPLIAAAFFFRWRGALVATTLFAPLYLGAVLLFWQWSGVAIDWLAVWTNLIGFYLISAAFGYAATLLARLRATGRDLAVLHDVTAELHVAADVAEVQEKVLETVTTALGFRRAVLGLVEETDEAISGWVGRVQPGGPETLQTLSHTARLPLTAEGGLAARALLERRVCRANEEPCTADRWLNSRFGMKNCLIIPLQWGLRPVGILLVDTGGQEIGEARRQALEAIARQTAVTIGMMRTRARLARESAVQAERGRIALDIHDVVSQALFGLVFTLDGSLRLLETEPEAVRPELEWALQTAERARREIRRAIHDLWPEEMTAASFTAELRHYLADVLQASHLQVEFDIRGDFELLSAPASRSLYRLAQECLTNVVHHAAATEARVCLDVEAGRARLVVRDDGRGFEPEIALQQLYDREHFGLRGMQERARALGGTCDIFSHPSAGTSVVVDIPAGALLATGPDGAGSAPD